MSRADIPEADRTDCVVVIDEFHSYLADGNSTMADALAESRKYRTSYFLSTPMLEQLDPATLVGVLGHCGSTLCMTVGPRDAEVLAKLPGSGLTPEDCAYIDKIYSLDATPESNPLASENPDFPYELREALFGLGSRHLNQVQRPNTSVRDFSVTAIRCISSFEIFDTAHDFCLGQPYAQCANR